VTNRAAYFDASALVKMYVQETHSIQVAALYESLDIATCHNVGFVEVRAALAMARRLHRLSDTQHAQQIVHFTTDWESVSTMTADHPLLLRAVQLAEGFSLRGYDALHLASADRFRQVMPDMLFVSFDIAINRAARLLGYRCPDFSP